MLISVLAYLLLILWDLLLLFAVCSKVQLDHLEVIRKLSLLL